MSRPVVAALAVAVLTITTPVTPVLASTVAQVDAPRSCALSRKPPGQRWRALPPRSCAKVMPAQPTG
jgi:hypothetical protein